MSKRKRKYNPFVKNCYCCDHCVYIGEGGYMCDVCSEIVVDDWAPTEDFYICGGKDFEQ